jgi:3alpha(or 20beta)-hydroxysteroid dehydrogenase
VTDLVEDDGRKLIGKVALVTGAARGQGRAIAQRLARAGVKVIAGDVADEGLDVLAAELGPTVLTAPLDVRDEDSWNRIVEQGLSHFGRIDILVNNAGVLRRASLLEETVEVFEDVWRTNCLGAFLGIRAVVPPMRTSGGGAIVNTSSTAGISAWPDHAAYGSSKWAVRGLTRVAALELARHGIRVNALLPGPIDTPMVIDPADPGASERLAQTPLGRIGQPADVADAVLFLVSAHSSFITGTELVIDGGQTAGAVATSAHR